MKEQPIAYSCGNTTCQGFIAIAESTQPLPVVIIAHAWRGLDDFAKKKAREIAQMGYIGFAADVYGEGKTAQTNDAALSLMLPLFKNRKLLRDRILSAYDQIQNIPEADSNKIASMGFCFGGTTVLELLRSGAKLSGTISVHGVLGDSIAEHRAQRAKSAEKLQGSLLFLHGDLDPLVSEQDLVSIKKEFTEALVDWQMLIFGHAQHAFTNPQAQDKAMGLLYNEVADRRSQQAITQFLKEVF